MFGTLGLEDLESTLPLLAEYGTKQFGTMHWKRSPSLAGFGDCQVASLFCPHCLEKPLSSAHFGLTTLAAMLQPWFCLHLCGSHVSNMSTLCAMLKSKLMMRHAAFSCQKKAGGFPQWRHVSGAVLIWNFGCLAHLTVLICLWSYLESEQSGFWWRYKPPASKPRFFCCSFNGLPDMTKHVKLDGSNQQTLHREKTSHAAMVQWLVEVSCLTRYQLGDDKMCWVESKLEDHVSIVQYLDNKLLLLAHFLSGFFSCTTQIWKQYLGVP